VYVYVKYVYVCARAYGLLSNLANLIWSCVRGASSPIRRTVVWLLGRKEQGAADRGRRLRRNSRSLLQSGRWFGLGCHGKNW